MLFSKFKAEDLQELEALFPTLDTVVTVKNCIYYLSLLEQFSQLLTKFRDHLDAFHVRAEIRYECWLISRGHRTTNDVAPPLDVAYIHHAHLLNPHRYLEDNHRIIGKMANFDLPLEILHEMYLNDGKPDIDSANFWKFGTSTVNEPFILQVIDIEGDTELPSPCKGCYSRLFTTWVDYGRWRLDPDSVFECWKCYKSVDSHTKAFDEFSADINIRGKSIASDLAYVR
ncbi:hypothetical protein BC941DRAFT_42749 [Chlamydoabsidia padenii]|nr:hypothetical protein BC941DRAFT_42749 [Chlamydoabsidia padenii]